MSKYIILVLLVILSCVSLARAGCCEICEQTYTENDNCNSGAFKIMSCACSMNFNGYMVCTYCSSETSGGLIFAIVVLPILVTIAIILCCIFCRGCPCYYRRNRDLLGSQGTVIASVYTPFAGAVVAPQNQNQPFQQYGNQPMQYGSQPAQYGAPASGTPYGNYQN